MRSLLLWPLLGGLVAAASADPFVLHSLSRTLEVGGSTARATSALVLEYTGAGGSDEALPFHVPVHLLGKVSYVEVKHGKGDTARLLPVRSGSFDPSISSHSFEIVVPQDLIQAGRNVSLTVSETFTHLTVPKPKLLEQDSKDGQYMFWSGDLLGGYARHRTVGKAVVRVRAPTPNVKSHKAASGFTSSHTRGSNQVVFSSSGSVSGEIVGSVHYEQSEPVISFRTLLRLVEVSHWSNNLAVEDNIALVNDGPGLKGHFARVTHQMQQYMRQAATSSHILNGLTFYLPQHATDPYFTDIVGNVSTSHFRPGRPVSPTVRTSIPAVVELSPRYPLLGGWTYNFTLGYNVPLETSLRVGRDGKHVLAVPFFTPVKDVAIDQVETRISLPEGATDIVVLPPFPVVTEQVTHSTFLDTTGRPTIVLRRHACSDRHGQEVLITYRYSVLRLLQKPLAVATAALALFVSGTMLRRVRWSIAPDATAIRAL